MSDSSGSKTCSDCARVLPVASFGKNRRSADQLDYLCKQCVCKKSARHREVNAEHYAMIRSAWRNKNRERISEQRNLQYSRDKTANYASSRAWAMKNRERARQLAREYQKRHPDVVAARVKLRRARKQKRAPEWLTNEQLNQIEMFYRIAKHAESIFGVKFEVDHIVPLQGRNVSGLHVPWNLQVILASTNRAKSNQHESD